MTRKRYCLISSKGEMLFDDIEMRNDFCGRLFGLMGRKSLPLNKAIILKPCNSIHTFFMKFNISVVFFDAEFKVIKIIEDIEVGKIVKPVKKAVYCLEYNSKAKKISINNQYYLKEKNG